MRLIGISTRACLGALLIGPLLALACGGPTDPSPTDAPSITCAAPQTIESPNGQAVAATFAPPSVVGGTSPVTTTCAPASGSTFPVGTTTVICNATDGRQRTASCSFTVRVTAPRISATKFLAFGDSITYGSAALCNRPLGGNALDWFLDDVRSLWANVVPGSYPAVLQALLQGRYGGQSPAVVNEGFPGESVVAPSTLTRLLGKLAEHAPEVVLLQEGVNDLHGAVPPASVASALRSMAREARNRNVQVFLGTLLPEVRRPGSCRAFHPELIEPTNSLIRSMAPSEGAVLVDLYAAFGGEGSPFIGEDGLHPSEAGYAKIAETFFSEIRARLEIQQTLSTVR